MGLSVEHTEYTLEHTLRVGWGGRVRTTHKNKGSTLTPSPSPHNDKNKAYLVCVLTCPQCQGAELALVCLAWHR